MEKANAAFHRVLADVDNRSAWKDTFVDALCEPPEVFSFGGTFAHVISFNFYVNVFTSHVNVGFFQGATLPDPARLLGGNGKFMRHVKLTPKAAVNATALRRLIEAAYSDMRAWVENG